MTKSQKSLLTTVIVVFAALTAALLLVFGFGAPTAASADDGAVSGVATVKVGENAAVGYDSIEEAWAAANAATSPATVKMYADAVTTDTLAIGQGKNITLDLNGFMLKYDNASANNSVISVSNAELTLIDTTKTIPKSIR